MTSASGSALTRLLGRPARSRVETNSPAWYQPCKPYGNSLRKIQGSESVRHLLGREQPPLARESVRGSGLKITQASMGHLKVKEREV